MRSRLNSPLVRIVAGSPLFRRRTLQIAEWGGYAGTKLRDRGARAVGRLRLRPAPALHRRLGRKRSLPESFSRRSA
jgi:hypothetical protein